MFPVVDVDGGFIESKRLIWGFPVMNYLELVAVVGIALSTVDLIADIAIDTGAGIGSLLQLSEIISYFLIIRLERKTSTWYVVSMLTIGAGIVLRVLLNILYLGLPVILESKNSFKQRLETNGMFAYFIPPAALDLTDDVVSGVRSKLLFIVFRSVLIVCVSCILFTFIERARELAKHLPEEGRTITPRELEAGRGTAVTSTGSKATGRGL